MKLTSFLFSCLALLLVSTACLAQKPKASSVVAAPKGYHIKAKIDNYSNDTLILGYRLGSKTYVKDTAIGHDSNGYFHFKRDTFLDGGIYIILVKPENTYFEFLIPKDNEQQLTIHTKAEDGGYTKNLKIEGSNDNKLFIDYLHFLGEVQKKSENTNKRYQEVDKEITDNPNASNLAKLTEERDQLRQTLENINKEVEAYQKNMSDKHPDYLCVSLIKAAHNPTVPKEVEAQGQNAAYLYYKTHYFDGFNWNDERLIRTPIFEQKLDFYLDKLTVQVPDSICISADYLIAMSKKDGNKFVNQYVASFILNKYAQSKVICMDKVYVYIGDKYYCNGGAEWVGEEQLKKICENVEELRYTQCGNQAQPITLTNIATNQPMRLYDIKKRYVAILFWDPTCGNCTKASQKLVAVYEKYKDQGLEIFGVCSKSIDEVEECKKKIDEVGMKWLNGTDKAYPLAVIKKLYDVKVNPFIFLLDQEKRIIYKRIDPEQLDDILKHELEKDNK